MYHIRNKVHNHRGLKAVFTGTVHLKKVYHIAKSVLHKSKNASPSESVTEFVEGQLTFDKRGE